MAERVGFGPCAIAPVNNLRGFRTAEYAENARNSPSWNDPGTVDHCARGGPQAGRVPVDGPSGACPRSRRPSRRPRNSDPGGSTVAPKCSGYGAVVRARQVSRKFLGRVSTRLGPPLVITRAQIDLAIEILEIAVDAATGG
jgi:hypothetical protein